MAENPYLVYAKLRDKDPVHFDESLNAWIVTKYDDIKGVLKASNFSIDRVTPVRDRFPDRYAPVLDDLSALLSQMDGPGHMRMRDLFNPGLSEKRQLKVIPTG